MNLINNAFEPTAQMFHIFIGIKYFRLDVR